MILDLVAKKCIPLLVKTRLATFAIHPAEKIKILIVVTTTVTIMFARGCTIVVVVVVVGAAGLCERGVAQRC
jgi:hypothetical protein